MYLRLRESGWCGLWQVRQYLTRTVPLDICSCPSKKRFVCLLAETVFQTVEWQDLQIVALMLVVCHTPSPWQLLHWSAAWGPVSPFGAWFC